MCNECYFQPGTNKKEYRRIKLNTTQTLHCLSGPAAYFSEGLEEWYVNGEYVTCSSQAVFEKSAKYREWKIKVFK